MRRTIEKYLENPISEEILLGNITSGVAVIAVAKGDGIRFSKPG
jgi:ATP-dependent Clp protease ATP-binding subunit ClpA